MPAVSNVTAKLNAKLSKTEFNDIKTINQAHTTPLKLRI